MNTSGTAAQSQGVVKVLPDIWLKAAMLGSLWASVEIILGSFLHNLHIPFSGTFLASIGVILMINGFKLWPNKGLFWRTALVTAAMKSISPSAIIIGPMVGIFMEGVILEILVRSFVGKWPGFILGGALAVSWSLFQKIFVLLMTYGPDFVKLYEQLYFMASRSFGFAGDAPFDLVKALFIIDLTFGGMVAGLAYRRTHSPGTLSFPRPKFDDTNRNENLFDASTTQPYSILLFALNFAILVLGLSILDELSLTLAGIMVITYVSLSIFRYNRSLKRLKRPQLWIQLFAVMGLSGLILGGWESTSALLLGIETGMSMAVRALLVIFTFSAISIELRNPLIMNWFSQRGMGVLFEAISLAFEVLPRLLKRVSEIDRIWRNPFKTLNQLLYALEDLRVEHQSQQPSVIILTGNQGDGKTHMVKALLKDEKLQDIAFRGFYSEGGWVQGERDSYQIVDLQTQASELLCERRGPVGEIKAGPFHFRQPGLEFGCNILDSISSDHANHVVIIDEIGHLELKDLGWSPSITKLLHNGTMMIWTVRPGLLDAVIAKWNIDCKTFDVKKFTQSQISESIRALHNSKSF
jgi:nucleoside-triphosphatase THEP1